MGYQERQIKLVDFIYKDTARLSSYFAQLFNGNLREISATVQSSTANSWQASGKIPALVEGNLGSEQSNEESITRTIDPHDQNALSFLEALTAADIPNHVPDGAIGQVAILEGEVTVRNYEMLSNSLPIFFSLGGTYGIPKTKKDEQKFVSNLIKLMPMGIELELVTINGQTLIGMLKPEYLMESPVDLSRIRGNKLPGNWYVMGIVDSLTAASSADNGDIRQALDGFSEAMSSMYSHSQATHVITPILIYRELPIKAGN